MHFGGILGAIYTSRYVYTSRYKNVGRKGGTSREEVPERSFRHLKFFFKDNCLPRVHDATLIYRGPLKVVLDCRGPLMAPY